MYVSIHGSIIKICIRKPREEATSWGGSADPRQKLNEGKEGSWDSSCKMAKRAETAEQNLAVYGLLSELRTEPRTMSTCYY